KAGAVSYHSTPANSTLNNIQLEYGNGTIVSVNYGKTDKQKEFRIKTFAANQFTRFDLIENTYSCNNAPIDFSTLKNMNETEDFLQSILQKKQSTTSVEDYSFVIQTVLKISSKLDHFAGN